jgi:hypothetical protein
MSYIRSTSNPEKLYIYGCGNHVHITTSMMVPEKIFRHLMRKLKKSPWMDSISHKGFKVYEDQRTFKWRMSYKNRHVDLYEVTLRYILDNNHWGR